MGEKFGGVDMDNPRIVEYTKNAIRQGWEKERIMKVIGVPGEVVDRCKREVERENKKK